MTAEKVRVLLHDARERDFSPVMQYAGHSVSATISFALTVPSIQLHDAQGGKREVAKTSKSRKPILLSKIKKNPSFFRGNFQKLKYGRGP
jgi:UDP-N-acetylglucosamine pyrophosphorylase